MLRCTRIFVVSFAVVTVAVLAVAPIFSSVLAADPKTTNKGRKKRDVGSSARAISPQEAADAVAANPTSTDHWLTLASVLGSQGVEDVGVSVNGEEIVGSVAAVAKALEIQPLNATLWSLLAYHQPTIETPSDDSDGSGNRRLHIATVEGKQYGRLAAIQRALEIDPSLDRAWVILASTLRAYDEKNSKTGAAAAAASKKMTVNINGEETDFLRAVEKAIGLKGGSAGGAWVELGRSMDGPDTTATTEILGERVTRRQCFERAVTAGKGKDFFAWYLLASELATSSLEQFKADSEEKKKAAQQQPTPEEQLRTAAKSMSKGFETFIDPETQTVHTVRDCLVRSIALEPTFANSWRLLADLTDTNVGADTSIVEIAFVKDGAKKKYTKKDLYVEALTLNEHVGNGAPWVNLGALMFKDPAPSVKINKKRYDVIDLLARGLAINPTGTPIAWVLLGQRMNTKQTVPMGSGVTITKMGALERGLELDPTIASGWAALGTLIPPRKTIKFERLGGKELGGKDCFKRALEQAQNVGQYFVSAAATMSAGETMEINGKKWGAVEMLTRALQLTPPPANYDILGFLGQRLHAEGKRGERFVLPADAAAKLVESGAITAEEQQQGLTPKQLLIKAVQLKPQSGYFYYALGGMLDKDEVVEMPDGKTKLDTVGMLLKTVELTPGNAMAYINLGLMLGMRPDGATATIPVKINGAEKHFGKKEFLVHGLSMYPDADGRAWQALADSLADGETVKIREKTVSKQDILDAFKQ